MAKNSANGTPSQWDQGFFQGHVVSTLDTMKEDLARQENERTRIWEAIAKQGERHAECQIRMMKQVNKIKFHARLMNGLLGVLNVAVGIFGYKIGK